ncbi:MAG: hypothetical protein RXR20_02575 [Paraburkholderia sp.]|mgnify:CR=1 FL=1|jgi:hypothetical protein|uniref:Uncharacterized protein n=1 Tax=Caballeronia udeis TaxID=1232866 RepID=A0A158GKE5_9BURK|nr:MULTISPECIES: hypothetical protein [Burkholderiaceae]SAL32556.1 hypothetical protein AWB69_02850 [Caballeronia udeis]
MTQSDNAKKETFGQKFAKKNGWITWVAFAAIAVVAVISLVQHH